jgi:hypothetical protein
MEFLGTLVEDLFGLDYLGIRDATVDWTHRGALFFLKMSNAFRALLGHDVIEIVRDRFMRSTGQFPLHTAGVNGSVRAFWFASPTIDALFSYKCRHSDFSFD